jgi:hypothetical protein
MQLPPRFPAGLLLGFTGFLCALTQFQGLGAAPTPTGEEEEFFEAKIRPVLVSQCYECHASESKKVKGGLLLDTREGLLRGGESGPALVPGKAAESMLVAALKHENLEMPHYVRSIRILTNNPRKLVGLDGYGLVLKDRVRIEAPSTSENASYLETKRTKLGHLFAV